MHARVDRAMSSAPPHTPCRSYFHSADRVRPGKETLHALDALAEAMAQQARASNTSSSIPPVFTYFSQFISHDIIEGVNPLRRPCANEAATPEKDGAFEGRGRSRAHPLNLDCLYGDTIGRDGPFGRRFQHALRFPRDRAKMWVGALSIVDGDVPPLQRRAIENDDAAWDVLRLGRTMEGPDPIFTEEELRALPLHLRRLFFVSRDPTVGDGDGPLNLSRAIIADPRNDQNLALSQLHLVFTRFHNSVVDEAADYAVDIDRSDEVFAWAQKMVRWHYQWLVVNVYLPKVCDPNVVSEVVRTEAPIYRAMLRAGGSGPYGRLPIPLEFSEAAFLFGHSLTRDEYDWNRYCGRKVEGFVNARERAPYRLLEAFTGDGGPPMNGITPSLPSNWPIEWDRFVDPVDPLTPDRSARRVDTVLASPTDWNGAQQSLSTLSCARGKEILRRGYWLNVPTAQGCLAAIEADYRVRLPVLTRDQIANEATAATLARTDLFERTPLWYYVLREAEVLGQDGRLGPLGSRLVAETLVGLVICDATTYWHQPGECGRWRPRDGVMPRGKLVDSMRGLVEAAGAL